MDNIEELKSQLKRKEQECERLKNDKFALELRLDELTSPVNVEDCEHSVFNGEYIACRYYEGQRCDDADFANCMFRENVRLKQQLDQLKAENDELKVQNIKYMNGNISYQLKNSLYKQTLTEIKEIAERDKAFCIKCNGDKDIDCVDCIEGGRALLAKDILQKISECEVE